MKKLFATTLLTVLFLTGCATNFQTTDAWKADKEGEKYAAEVLTSEVKDGVIYGTAKIYKTGAVVKYVQKPYYKTERPFDKGFTIFVNIDGNK